MFDVDPGPHQLKDTTQRLVVEVELQGAPSPRRDHLANSRQLYEVEHLRLQVGAHDLGDLGAKTPESPTGSCNFVNL